MAEAAQWLVDAVADFGADARQKLAGPGDREAAIRAPLEGLLKAAGSALGVPAVFHDEVRDEERRVRPDYGVSVKGLMAGYVEVKAPGRGIDDPPVKQHVVGCSVTVVDPSSQVSDALRRCGLLPRAPVATRASTGCRSLTLRESSVATDGQAGLSVVSWEVRARALER